MRFFKQFKELTKFEIILWLVSVAVVAGSFFLFQSKDHLTLISSLIGVTALIFLAKGMVIGQVLVIIFAVFYGIISFFFSYYGEVITYLCMSAPTAFISLVSWIKHPYKDSHQVEVAKKLTARSRIVLIGMTVAVTVAFYFILGALGNANLIVSTVSVTTSFLASMLMVYRSPYYAVAYAANDIVLIVLWVMASMEDISYVPMVACFVMFFFNDIYGFINWRKMKREQKTA